MIPGCSAASRDSLVVMFLKDLNLCKAVIFADLARSHLASKVSLFHSQF